MLRLPAFLLALLAFLLVAPPAGAQLPVPGQKAMSVRLVSEGNAPPAGGRVMLAIVMSPRPGWHGYWKNPGDAGVETRIDWRLPAGVTAGPILYPVPETLFVGGFMNYVYKGQYAQLIALDVPRGLQAGPVLPLRGTIFYLVCTDQVCVPETAGLALDLRVAADGAGPARRAEFDLYRSRLPRPLGAEARFERKGDRIRVGIPLPASVRLPEPYFFPLTENAVDHSAPQSLSRRGDLLIVEAEAGRARPRALEGVLRLGSGDGLALVARPGEVPEAGTPVTATPGGREGETGAAPGSARR